MTQLYPSTAERTAFHVPEELASLKQFVAWRYGKARTDGKREKLPIDPRSGKRAKTDDPETWGSLSEALRCAEERDLDGIGFVFTASDPYGGIDLDDCRNPDTGELEPRAQKVVEKFDSYAEVSPSGTGVKIIVKGQLPGPGTNRGKVELYDQRHFFTLTGDVLEGYETVNSRPRLLAALYRKLKRPRLPQGEAPKREPVPVPLEDEELLDKARSAGNGKKFRQLFDEGDVSAYSSHSEADLALCVILAFWTGRDRERMERLFKASALRRPKSDRPDYLQSTIDLAVNRCERTYNPEPCADGEVHKILEELRRFAVLYPWTGRSGPRERWLYGELINTGGGYGKACAEGVIVAASSRDVALEAGTHRQTVERLFKKLEERGLVRLIEKAKGKKAAKYLLLNPPPKYSHKEESVSPKCVHKINTPIPPHCVYKYGHILARLRDAAPQAGTDKLYDKNGQKIAAPPSEEVQPLGAFRALVVEKILAWPGLTEGELAAVMERQTHHVRRYLPLLLACGLVVEKDGALFAAEDLGDRLLDELKESGCNRREKDLRDKYEDEREWHRVKLLRRRGFSPKQIAERLEITVERVYEILRKPDRVPTDSTGAELTTNTTQEDDESGLTEEEREALVAIVAYERKHGRGSFGWDRASCKKMFHMGPYPGQWPDAEGMALIRKHLEASGHLIRA